LVSQCFHPSTRQRLPLSVPDRNVALFIIHCNDILYLKEATPRRIAAREAVHVGFMQ